MSAKKRHSWAGGIEQHCINPGCPWTREWLPSARKDGETKRRQRFVRDDGWVQRMTPDCGGEK